MGSLKIFLEAIFFSFEASAQLFSSSFYVISLSQKISLCVSVNHNPELRCAICTGVTLFALNYTLCAGVLHLNCTALSQSESSNFFMYIINNNCFIIDCFRENIQKLLCEMQVDFICSPNYKHKRTKRPHHSKPFKCSRS